MNGFINIFYGDISHIPQGWALCNGLEGTPDLSEHFIKGCNDGADLGGKGGATTHVHTMSSAGVAHSHSVDSGGSHRHGTVSGSVFYGASSSVMTHYTDFNSHGSSVSSENDAHTHNVNGASSEPKSFLLAYVMLVEQKEYDFPKNSIQMWGGDVTNIPKGYVFCDGTEGTPDLRNRFIKGAISQEEIGLIAEGGHTHTVNSVAHTHTVNSSSFSHNHGYTYSNPSDYNVRNTNASAATETVSTSHAHTLGSANTHTHSFSKDSPEPLYYKLAFIKKVA